MVSKAQAPPRLTKEPFVQGFAPVAPEQLRLYV